MGGSCDHLLLSPLLGASAPPRRPGRHMEGGSSRRKLRRATELSPAHTRIAGFAASPPALLTCISGPKRGKVLKLPSAWDSKAWLLSEDLKPVDGVDGRDAVENGCVLTSVGGSFYVQGLNEKSKLWVLAGASVGGSGIVRINDRVDLLRLHGQEVRVGDMHGSKRSSRAYDFGSNAASSPLCNGPDVDYGEANGGGAAFADDKQLLAGNQSARRPASNMLGMRGARELARRQLSCSSAAARQLRASPRTSSNDDPELHGYFGTELVECGVSSRGEAESEDVEAGASPRRGGRKAQGQAKHTHFRPTATIITNWNGGRRSAGSGMANSTCASSDDAACASSRSVSVVEEEVALKGTPLAPHKLLGGCGGCGDSDAQLHLWVKESRSVAMCDSHLGDARPGDELMSVPACDDVRRRGEARGEAEESTSTRSGKRRRQRVCLSLTHGDRLVLTPAGDGSDQGGSLSVLKAADDDVGIAEAAAAEAGAATEAGADPSRRAKRAARIVARAERHGGVWWLLASSPAAEVDAGAEVSHYYNQPASSSGRQRHRSSSGKRSRKQQAASAREAAEKTRRLATESLAVRVGCAPARALPLVLGASFMLGTNVYRLERPARFQRREEEMWSRLAVCVGGSASAGASEFYVLPPWRELHKRVIGRAAGGSVALGLRDLKVRRRHVRLLLSEFCHEETNGALKALTLVAEPNKGKPVKLLLGCAGRCLRERWRLRLGDIFCVGLTQLRVARVSVPSPARVGEWRILSDDGQRYRRREAKEEKRAGKLREEPSLQAEGLGDGGEQLIAQAEGRSEAYTAESAPAAAPTAVPAPSARVIDLARQTGDGHGDSSSDEEEEVEDVTGCFGEEEEAAEEERLRAAGDGDGDELEDPTSDAPRLVLELIAGPMRGRWVELAACGGTVGSSEGCTLTLHNDLTVSPLHASIVHDDGRWYLSDLGSSDGTHLLLADAGTRVDAGDRLRLGRTDVTFYMRPSFDETCCRTVGCCVYSQEGADDVWRSESATWLREHAHTLSRDVLHGPHKRRRVVLSMLLSILCIITIATTVIVVVVASNAASYDPCSAFLEDTSNSSDTGSYFSYMYDGIDYARRLNADSAAEPSADTWPTAITGFLYQASRRLAPGGGTLASIASFPGAVRSVAEGSSSINCSGSPTQVTTPPRIMGPGKGYTGIGMG